MEENQGSENEKGLSNKETYIKIRDQDTLDLFINKVVTVRKMTGRSLKEYKAQLLLSEGLIKEIREKYYL